MPLIRSKIKNIFVTGGIHSGKTTVLNRVISGLPHLKVGGFRTVPIIEHGVKKGFIFESLTGDSMAFAHVTLDTDRQFDIYRYDLSVFDDLGVKSLTSALSDCDLILMDEIGMMERDSVDFRQMILNCLNSFIPVLGSFQQRAAWFSDLLRIRSDTKIFEVTTSNRETLPGEIIAVLSI